MNNKLIYILLLIAAGIFIYQQEFGEKNTEITQSIVSAPTTHGCQENICGGTYTGVTDDKDCKIYGLEICKIETDCKLVEGIKICNPQPYAEECIWETANDYGRTYVTKADNCGFGLEGVCGTSVEYRCVKDVNSLCTLTYTKETDTYTKGCGGYV